MSPGGGAGEKTERATPKKRRDAREKGQVRKSTEINTSLCCIVMVAFMLLFTTRYIQGMLEVYYTYLNEGVMLTKVIDTSLVQTLYGRILIDLAKILLPVLLCALLIGLLVNYLQVGFLFTTKPLMPKLERISPISGFKRIFSSRTVMELLKSLLKVVLLGYILYREQQNIMMQVPSLMAADIYTSFIEILRMAFRLCLKMALVLVVIAVFDFAYQWWKYEKDLRMSKQEIKDEYKLTEGDPLIKSKIRQKQRQMSAMRMMEQVPTADVVITNPTHYAIALKYEDGKSNAPVVVAKGKDFLARKIKEKAHEHGIEMVENKPLAQSLYLYCEVGDEIPADFYQAVADILVYVYRLKKKLRGVR